jgi:hypothetical protein
MLQPVLLSLSATARYRPRRFNLDDQLGFAIHTLRAPLASVSSPTFCSDNKSNVQRQSLLVVVPPL